LFNNKGIAQFLFGSIYFLAKMLAATGLAETKQTQKINPKGNPNAIL